MKERVLYFDTARVICMLWIVCIWHLSASIEKFPNLSNPICVSITVAALSTFTYISAFFVSGKVKKTSDIIPFYKKRFARFYILYTISCISMLIARFLSGSESMMTLRQFFLSLLGLSTIVGPAPITLWFFSMLIIFYIITPFIDLIKKYYVKILGLITIYLALICAIHFFNGDLRVLVFYPSYCLGILTPKETKRKVSTEIIFKEKRFLKYIFVNFAFLIIAVIIYSNHFESDYWVLFRIPIALASIGTILFVSKQLSLRALEKQITFLSYISMCVYLFHSQFYWIAELIFGKMNYVTAYFLVVPSLFFACWTIQKIYDIFILQIGKRRII